MFRQWYKAQLMMRVLDFIGHCLAAAFVWMLTSAWAAIPMQWYPDICLLYMWPHGMITNRMLPENSLVLRVHRWLHSPFFAIACAVWLVFVVFVFPWMTKPSFIAMISVVTHQAIDMFTHEEQSNDRCADERGN